MSAEKQRKRMFSFIVIHVIAPLVLGAVLYYIFLPDTLFVKYMDEVMGVSGHIAIDLDNILLREIRFYLFDFLWAYALMSMVILFWGRENVKILLVVLLFEIVLETLQFVPAVKGTFDVCDILVEIWANILAIITCKGER